VIIAMPLAMVNMPPNILQVFSGFKDIVNLKIIDTKQALNWLSETIMPHIAESGVPHNQTFGLNITSENNSSAY